MLIKEKYFQHQLCLFSCGHLQNMATCCFKYLADAEFLPNQRGTHRSGQKQPELNPSSCCYLTANLQTNHPKSAQNSEKSSDYKRVLTEELLRTFSFGHHLHQSSE